MVLYDRWTDEEAEALQRMWAEGLLVVTIAQRLDRNTNQIAGKVKRLGLPARNLNTREIQGVAEGQALWTEGEQARLKELWVGSELTAAQIAEALAAEFGHNRTKNAVLGQVHRANLPTRKPPKPVLAYADDTPGAVTQESTRAKCAWPIGDPRKPDFRYCGAEPVPERPYCHDHCMQAFWTYAKRHGVDAGPETGDA